MAESIRSKANRYARGDFTKGELLTIIGGFVADQVIDDATYGQLSRLKGKALTKIVFPAGKKAGSIIARGALGTAGVAGRSLVCAAAPIVGSAGFPIAAGTALGLGALQTPPGQELLAMAEERGRADRDRLQFMLDWFEGAVEDPTIRTQVKQQARRKVSKYQKGVKAGMKAVKQSSFIGKKGTISNAKRAFTTVSKVTSKVNKGKKVSAKGVTGVIKRAVGKFL